MSQAFSPSGVRRWMFQRIEWLDRNRSRIRRWTFVIVCIGATLMLAKFARPFVWRWIGIDLLARSTQWPSVILEAGLLAWLLTLDWTSNSIRSISQSWSRPQQFLLLVLCANVWAAGNCLLNYPEHLINSYRNSNSNVRPEMRKIRGYDSVPIEGFAAKCCKETPKNARILYHGTQEGWLFAYEVYPRRVYMLPEEGQQLSGTWHKKRWLHKLWPDALETYWNQPTVMTESERATFIAERGITHEVFYEAGDSDRCRCEVIR